MATITLNNIPATLYERLKATAKIHHRSINSKLIHCLKTLFTPTRVSPEEQLARFRNNRPAIAPDAVSPEDIQQGIDQGRP